MNHDGPADPIIAAFNPVLAESVTITIDTAALIVLNRDHRIYQWRDYADAPFR